MRRLFVYSLLATSCTLPACMFFVSLEELDAEVDRPQLDAGPETSAAPDGAFCSLQRTGFFACFDYEGADAALVEPSTYGVTPPQLGIAAGDGVASSRGLAVRVAPSVTGVGGYDLVTIPNQPRAVELSAAVREEGAALEDLPRSLFAMVLGGGNLRVIWDPAARTVGVEEEFPTDEGRDFIRHAGRTVALTSWHRLDLVVSIERGIFTFRIDGSDVNVDVPIRLRGSAPAFRLGVHYVEKVSQPYASFLDDAVIRATY